MTKEKVTVLKKLPRPIRYGIITDIWSEGIFFKFLDLWEVAEDVQVRMMDKTHGKTRSFTSSSSAAPNYPQGKRRKLFEWKKKAALEAEKRSIERENNQNAIKKEEMTLEEY